jgi:hypothetical protein
MKKISISVGEQGKRGGRTLKVLRTQLERRESGRRSRGVTESDEGSFPTGGTKGRVSVAGYRIIKR